MLVTWLLGRVGRCSVAFWKALVKPVRTAPSPWHGDKELQRDGLLRGPIFDKGARGRLLGAVFPRNRA